MVGRARCNLPLDPPIASESMLTDETVRKFAQLDRDLLEKRIRGIYETREKGAIDAMVAFGSPDIVCFPHSDWRPRSFPHPIVGKAALAETFRLRNIQYENLGSTIDRILIDGDQAAVFRTTTIRERGASETHTFAAIDFFRFRDGLVVEFSEYTDGVGAEVVRHFPL